MTSHSKLGFGIGFRAQHYHELLQAPQSIDWLEVISDNLMTKGDRFLRKVETVSQHWPVALHGVGLSIAGADPLEPSYLRNLAELVQRLKPVYVSDHLCWSQFQGRSFYDLLPLPYTRKNLRLICERLKQLQDLLGQRFFLENPSAYLSFRDSEFGEAEFLAELCLQSGCGILLDINNLFVNHCNLGLDIKDYLQVMRDLPICYLHLAGHSDCGDIIIDTHDRPVAPAVWELYQLALEQLGWRDTLIEWDASLPDLEGLKKELQVARDIAGRIAGAQVPAAQNRQNIAARDRRFSSESEDFWQPVVAGIIEQDMEASVPEPGFFLSMPSGHVSIHRGLQAYQNNFRGFFLDILGAAFPRLAKLIGDKLYWRWAHGFIDQSSRPNDIISAVLEFPGFLQDYLSRIEHDELPHAVGVIVAVAYFEGELYRLQQFAAIHGSVGMDRLQNLTADDWYDLRVTFIKPIGFLQLEYTVHPLIEELDDDFESDRDGLVGEPAETHYRFYMQDDAVCYRVCQAQESGLYEHLRQGHSLADGIERAFGQLDETTVAAAVSMLVTWIQDRLVSQLSSS